MRNAILSREHFSQCAASRAHFSCRARLPRRAVPAIIAAQRNERTWLEQSKSKKEAAMSSPTSDCQIRKSVSLRLDLLFALPESFTRGGSLRLAQPAS